MLPRCFLFLFCGERMTAGHGLWFVLPVRRGKWLTVQCHSFSCGFAVCSGLFLAEISCSVRVLLRIIASTYVLEVSKPLVSDERIRFLVTKFVFRLLLLASLFRQLIGHFVSMYVGMCRYPLKYDCCS